MKWPWVLRMRYDAEHARAERLSENYGRLYQQNLVLNAQLLSAEAREFPLRLFDPTKAVAPTVPRIPSPLEKRIDEVSEGDGRIKRHFWQYVARERKAGKSDGDIMPEIRWQTTETE